MSCLPKLSTNLQWPLIREYIHGFVEFSSYGPQDIALYVGGKAVWQQSTIEKWPLEDNRVARVGSKGEYIGGTQSKKRTRLAPRSELPSFIDGRPTLCKSTWRR